jgi:hypothetical protein
MILALVATIAVGCAGPHVFTTSLTDTRSTVGARLTDQTGSVQGIDFVHPVPDWALRAAPAHNLVNAGDNAVLVRFVGGTCDSTVALATVAEQSGRVGLHLDLGAPCQEDVGKIRVLQINFDHPVPAQTVDLEVASPAPTPGG